MLAGSGARPDATWTTRPHTSLLALAGIGTSAALMFAVRNPLIRCRLLVTVAVALLGALALLIFPNAEFLTTSAIVAAILGFALQETLGNAFAGLAIQIERPFRVGHWITVQEFEGEVREITWRATKIWTKQGNMVVLPNSVVAGAAINNYSEPLTPTRLFVEVAKRHG